MKNNTTITRVLPVRNTIWIWFSFATAIVLAPGLSASLAAEPVAIVLSDEAGPYRQAQTGVEKHLSQIKQSRDIYLLSEVTKDFKKISPEVRIFIAVGTKVTLWLHKNISAPTKLVYCMVSDPEGLGLLEGLPALGISIDIPLTTQFDLIKEALASSRRIGML